MKESQYTSIMSVLFGILASMQEEGDWFAFACWFMFALLSVCSAVNWYLEKRT